MRLTQSGYQPQRHRCNYPVTNGACTNAATMLVAADPSDTQLHLQVYTDLAAAPRPDAHHGPYCTTHGLGVLRELVTDRLDQVRVRT